MFKIDLIVVALTPCIAFALAIYFADRYDKEPLKYLLLVFFLGCVMTLPALVLERVLLMLNSWTGIAGIFYKSFVVIAIVEESLKWIIVYKVVYKKPFFDEPLDGIIYSAFVALGFASIENVIYVVFRYSHVPDIALYRAVISVPAHCLYAITMGYYLGLSKFSKKRTKLLLSKSFFMPIIYHGFFDFILMGKFKPFKLYFFAYLLLLWVVNLYLLWSLIDDAKKRKKAKENGRY